MCQTIAMTNFLFQMLIFLLLAPIAWFALLAVGRLTDRLIAWVALVQERHRS
jgi:hypothetical protein